LAPAPGAAHADWMADWMTSAAMTAISVQRNIFMTFLSACDAVWVNLEYGSVRWPRRRFSKSIDSRLSWCLGPEGCWPKNTCPGSDMNACNEVIEIGEQISI
jgi:hypothetical protein